MIVIGIIAFRNPQNLLETLKSLEAMKCPHGQNIEVVVVDNDELKSAEEIVQTFSKHSKLQVIYISQLKKGKGLLKNEVLHYAVKMFIDYVAFIDSGKIVDELWLDSLFNALLTYKADVATGPVRSRSKSKITVSKKKTGLSLFKNVRANNVIISAQIYKRWMQRFDNNFSAVQGEDADFFYRSWKKGGKHVWVEEAVIYGVKDKPAKTFPEIAAKHTRLGIMHAMIYILRNKKFIGHAILLPKIIERFFVGFALLFIGTIYAVFAPSKAKDMLYRGIYKFCWLKGVMKHFFTLQRNN